MEKVIILATDEAEASVMAGAAKAQGRTVLGSKVWEGPIPPNSYMFINPFVRMSTPEFYLFRQCNMLGEKTAVAIAAELFSHFATWKTMYAESEGYIERVEEPRTTPDLMREYLAPVLDTHEGMVALEIVNRAVGMVGVLEDLLERMLSER